MANKIESLRQERKNIIKSYSAKNIENTYIDSEVSKTKDIQHVIVSEIIDESSDTKSFILTSDSSKGTNELAMFKAGQYISVKLNINEEYATRAYSLASSPAHAAKNIYRITVKRVRNGLVSNYLLDNIKVGDSLTISKPTGNFTYNSIRDEKNVIAIAGGSGITPFMSLALAIEDGLEDCDLTIFYSVRTYDDMLFKKEIELLNKKSKRVKIHVVITREEKEGSIHGYINKDVLAPAIKEFNTVFMCGPKSLYKAMNTILSEFNIPRKSVHYENFYIDYNPSNIETYELKVILKNDFVLATCKSNVTLLESMEQAGIKAPSSCRVGVCGFCRSVLLEGKIKMIGSNMNKAVLDNDYIHPCVTYPESDIVLRLDI